MKRVSKSGRIKSGGVRYRIGRIDKYARTPEDGIGEDQWRGGRRRRRRFISRTTRKRWKRAVPRSVVSVGRSVGRCARADVGVGAWPATRVCAWTMQGQSRRRALLCATGAPLGPQRAPRFARSGSTLKRGIYRV